MSIFKNITRSFKQKRINKTLKNYKYVHLMFNDKFNKPFVDFLNRNFDSREHLVLCKRLCKNQPFPEGKNVVEIDRLKKLNFENNEKVICHSLFDWEVIDYLYKHQDILKEKAYWIMWGGDLYNAQRDEINDFVRKNFKGYVGIMDKEYATKKYNLDAPFYNVHYPFSTTSFDETANIIVKTDKTTRIQINNSCDESTLQAMDFIKNFKDEDIVVTTILSYGNLKYKDEIIEKGRNYFGDKFEYLDRYLDSAEYKNFVANNDVLILNQNRQQGVGNMILYLQQGKKVFVRNEISTFKYLNEVENVKIFDTLSIPTLSFKEFITNNYVEQNRKNIKNWTNEKCLVSLWREFFNA